MRMSRKASRIVGLLVAAALGAAGGCTPYTSTQEKLQAHFAVGKNWPDAIGTLEKVVGPGLVGGSCSTDLGTIVFTKMQTGEYVLSYPTRGAGAPGNAMLRSPDAFAAALMEAFSNSRCTHAEIQYEHYAVVVDVESADIKTVNVSRSR
jgi:hypothetical protein